MKKKKCNIKDISRVIALISVLVMLAGILVMFVGCTNVQLLDTTWSFEQAIIFMPDGKKLEGKVTSWLDFDGSDMIQVTIDSKTYLTHSANVVLISE